MTFAELTRIAQTSGDILYLMVLLLFVAIVVTLERTWVLRRMLARGQDWLALLRRHARLDPATLQNLLDAGAPGPHAGVVAAGLTVQPGEPAERIADLLEEAVMEQAPRVDRGLWMLDTIVTLAPLLGLLGTIIGMFNTFQALSNPGAASQQVTGGVGEALVATASGLFVAILGLVAFNFLNQRVRLVMHQLERVKLMLLNRLAATPARAASAASDTVAQAAQDRDAVPGQGLAPAEGASAPASHAHPATPQQSLSRTGHTAQYPAETTARGALDQATA
ncbi:MAG: MotA/TolQ/ExbB proton channel family protein [Betaproteobacteria bacterium]|nr:MotA/TolQ/ExbB proton channel family protein [Betaproteobacteria bacterium]MDE2124893.1 MotA/TolQ/ExbB proton channel family protein [Betaproteobacteria bacterium]MDE2187840.1 MotA/TolQ/ExbB proton channel family protein [Betaproteobacteria bacterium]MDE2324661.1 MotA/TolQ/ExbB proton channel family protein [Betaproteobacteria bacterium]